MSSRSESVVRRLSQLLGVALDALLPARCLACGGLVHDPGALCPACWDAISFLGPPLCACCGLPFEVEVGEGTLCGGCIDRPPPWRRARAVLRYDDSAKGLILRFKHADRCDAAPAFARWMARAGSHLLADADVIAPVPLHRWRLLRRRYNQAALLAMALGRQSRVTAIPDLLVRRRATPSQGNLGRDARLRNVRGAFAVRPSLVGLVAGRNVLLVDDVLTTGATVGECVRVLKAAGAGAVDVLTLARVVAPRG